MATSGDSMAGVGCPDRSACVPVEEREHHTPHRVDGEEPHAIVVDERTNAFPAGGTGEIETHFLEIGVV